MQLPCPGQAPALAPPCCCPAAPPVLWPSADQDTDPPDSISQPTPGHGPTEPFLTGLLSSNIILLRARSYCCLHSPPAPCLQTQAPDRQILADFHISGAPWPASHPPLPSPHLGKREVRATVNGHVCACGAHKHLVHNDLKQAKDYRYGRKVFSDEI